MNPGRISFWFAYIYIKLTDKQPKDLITQPAPEISQNFLLITTVRNFQAIYNHTWPQLPDLLLLEIIIFSHKIKAKMHFAKTFPHSNKIKDGEAVCEVSGCGDLKEMMEPFTQAQIKHFKCSWWPERIEVNAATKYSKLLDEGIIIQKRDTLYLWGVTVSHFALWPIIRIKHSDKYQVILLTRFCI